MHLPLNGGLKEKKILRDAAHVTSWKPLFLQKILHRCNLYYFHEPCLFTRRCITSQAMLICGHLRELPTPGFGWTTNFQVSVNQRCTYYMCIQSELILKTYRQICYLILLLLLKSMTYHSWSYYLGLSSGEFQNDIQYSFSDVLCTLWLNGFTHDLAVHYYVLRFFSFKKLDLQNFTLVNARSFYWEEDIWLLKGYVWLKIFEYLMYVLVVKLANMLDFITKSSSDQVPYFHTLLRHTGDLNFCLKHLARILFFIIIVSIFLSSSLPLSLSLLYFYYYHSYTTQWKTVEGVLVSYGCPAYYYYYYFFFIYYTKYYQWYCCFPEHQATSHSLWCPVLYPESLLCPKSKPFEVKKCSHIVPFRHPHLQILADSPKCYNYNWNTCNSYPPTAPDLLKFNFQILIVVNFYSSFPTTCILKGHATSIM